MKVMYKPWLVPPVDDPVFDFVDDPDRPLPAAEAKRVGASPKALSE